MPDIVTNESSNTFSINDIDFSAWGDRLLILEDAFRSGYECQTCLGSGKVVCHNCGGNGRVGENNLMCSHCQAIGEVTCPDCDGKGGLLVVPEDQQRRPTTGRIVSVGPKVTALRVGESVLYSSYAGHTLDLYRASGEKVVLRVIHEPEVLCLVNGHLELRHLRGNPGLTQYQS